MKKKTKVIMAIAMAVVMLCSMALTVCAVLPSGKKYDYTYYPKKNPKITIKSGIQGKFYDEFPYYFYSAYVGMRYDEYNANENLSGSPLYNTLQVTVAVRRPSGAIVEKMGSAELFISNSEKDYFGLNCVFSKEAKENILKCDFTARLYDESKEEYQYTEITIPEMTVTYRDLVTSQ